MSKDFRESRVYKLATESEVFKLAVQSAFNHIIITDPDGVVLYANSAVERITGYSEREVLGKTPRLWGGLMDEELYKKMWHTIKEEKKPFEGEFRNMRKDGREYFARAIISPIIDNKELLGFIGTEEDITHEKQVDQMKTEFISITAHQLKTPLTSIGWGLDMLEDTSFGELSVEQSDIVKTIRDSSERLSGLVNILLNISRLESGRLTIKPKEVEVEEFIESILAMVHGQLKQKGHTVSLNIDPAVSKIVVDPQMAGELLKNFLTNAIKYTNKGGEIVVRVEKLGDSIRVSVKDTGQGIPKAEQQKIFDRFFRASNIDKSQEGTGLGLYFAKLIADSSGCEIGFESEEGKGSTFFILIPKEGMTQKEGEISLSTKIHA